MLSRALLKPKLQQPLLRFFSSQVTEINIDSSETLKYTFENLSQQDKDQIKIRNIDTERFL